MAGLVPAIPTLSMLGGTAIFASSMQLGMAGTDPRNKSGDGHDGVAQPKSQSFGRLVLSASQPKFVAGRGDLDG